MFNTISWPDFLFTIAILCGGYYLICGTVLYHREILEWLKDAKQTHPHSADVPTPVEDNGDDLLGKIRKTATVHDDEYLDEADEIQFGKSKAQSANAEDSSPDIPDPDGELIIGKVSDLLEEAKTLTSLFADEKASREDIGAMFRALLEKYTALTFSRYAEAINIFLYDLCKDACAFELHPDDVKSWWPSNSHN
jgi:hypothetical protein